MVFSAAFAPKKLMNEAREAAGGLDDFGDDSFQAALSALSESLVDDARLSSRGTELLHDKLVWQLTDRLRLEDYFARHPEIAMEVIAPPLVIVGLPYTGATKLHRLLTCDTRFNYMTFWESQFPVPVPGEDLTRPERRQTEAEAVLRTMQDAVPTLSAIHPMATQTAGSENLLLEHSMRSIFGTYAYVPGYEKWLQWQDMTPAYRYLHRMLQFLQWQQRQRGITGQRWVLKAPVHLRYLEVLLRIFPGTQIIQTHHDPLVCMPELIGLIHELWSIYSDDIRPEATARLWSQRMCQSLTHAMNVRENYPSEQFLDIHAYEVADAPTDTLQRIYDFIGWSLDDSIRDAHRNWLDHNAQFRLPSACPADNAELGLDDSRLREDFADYRARYLGVRT